MNFIEKTHNNIYKEIIFIYLLKIQFGI
ncbi:hypothetical protein, partial [Plasmodium yoelii yoelii]